MTDAETIREKLGTLPNEFVMRYFALLRQRECYMDIERIELRVFPADGSEYTVQMNSRTGEVVINSYLRGIPEVPGASNAGYGPSKREPEETRAQPDSGA